MRKRIFFVLVLLGSLAQAACDSGTGHETPDADGEDGGDQDAAGDDVGGDDTIADGDVPEEDAGIPCVPREELPDPVLPSVELETTCGAAPTCGGAVDETRWEIEAWCLETTGLFSQVFAVCSTASALSGGGEEVSGTLSFADGVMDLQLHYSAAVAFTFPNECHGCRCTDLEAMLPVGARCNPVCSGGDCFCTLEGSLDDELAEGYEVQDAVIVADSGRRFDFCRDGDRLSLGLPSGVATFADPEILATPEICNGRDDDRNNAVDDEVQDCPPACLEEGVCALGSSPACQGLEGWACQYDSPDYEVDETTCDTRDNDCDGQADELPQCAEICDGIDNDGSGVIDDNLTDTPPGCPAEGGVCASGVEPRCDGADGWRCHYTSPDYEFIESRCDGLDNDCDGVTDETCGGCLSAERLYVAIYEINSYGFYNGSIGYQEVAGTGQQSVYSNCGDCGGVHGMVVDEEGGKVYFLFQHIFHEIWQVNTDGTGAEMLRQLPQNGEAIAFDPEGRWLYWANTDLQTIERSNLADLDATETIVTGVAARRMVVAGVRLYWIDGLAGQLGVYRARLDGSDVEQVAAALREPAGLTVDLVQDRIYWSDTYDVWSADLNGASPVSIVYPDGSAGYLAVDPWAGTLYMGLSLTDRLDRVNLDGTGRETLDRLSLYYHYSGLALTGCHVGG